MKELEKYITDERTGLKYELLGDYYFHAGDDGGVRNSGTVGANGRNRTCFCHICL